jgi:type IV secretory pathway ATPase VirB11/archaellum biosynthesis ATPase
MPILDLEVPEYGTRVCTIGKPVAPDGVSFALRRAKPTPWTLPQFIENGMLDPFSAGLISFLIDGQSTMLVAGSRGAGKTSLLAAVMGELPQRSRILTIEDTLELPVTQLNETGFKIQRLKVQSAVSGGDTEMGADEALRAALRLGDSVLVMGEVRGPETKVLYEAMRVGAAGNAVMGTIHGSSTRDVFERVVYDLGVAPLSFKGTDVVIIASPVRPHGSSKRVRRVRQISEIGKNWSGEADSDRIFEDLMLYDASKDALVPTDILLESRSEVILKIAKSWGISYGEAIKNIELRGRMKELMVEYKEKFKVPDLLEVLNVQRANNHFHLLVDRHQKEYGKIDYEKLYDEWKEWLDGYVGYLK